MKVTFIKDGNVLLTGIYHLYAGTKMKTGLLKVIYLYGDLERITCAPNPQEVYHDTEI